MLVNVHYATALIVAAIAASATMGVVWRRRKTRGAIALMVFFLGLVIWSLTYALHWLAAAPEWRYVWLNLTYVGALIVPGTFFAFVISFTNRDDLLPPQRIWILIIVPLLMFTLLWTDPLHNLFFAGKRVPTNTYFYDGGIFFWINVIYSYGLLLIATVLLLRSAIRFARFYRWQFIMIVISLLIPWLVNGLGLLNVIPWAGLDASPVAFTFTALVVFYNMVGRNFLEIVPVAREILLENLVDGLLLLDEKNRVVDFNQAAHDLLLPYGSLEIGKSIDPIWQQLPQAIHFVGDIEETDSTEVLIPGPNPVYLDLRVKPIFSEQNTLLGRMYIWRDMTKHREIEITLKFLNAQLNSQMAEIKLLQEKLRDQANRDGLTGVYNRRYLNEAIKREVIRCLKSKCAISVIIMDVDHFKQVNDRFGHIVGDQTLIGMVEELSKSLRNGDILCRYGGEEFVILMPDTDLKTAAIHAEKISTTISTHIFRLMGHEFRVTVSIGVASFPDHAGTAESLLLAADNALYAAKDEGRNRVSIFNNYIDTSRFTG